MYCLINKKYMLGKNKSSLLPACGFIISLLLILASVNTSFAQEYSQLDSLKIGTQYKIILFDDTEIIGRIIKNDSEFVVVNTGLKDKRIRKDDIYNISRDLTPSKYRFIFAVGGGVSFLTNGLFEDRSSRHKSLFSLQLNSTFLTSSSKGFRIDLGYSRFKRNDDVYSWGTDFKGGDMEIYSFKTDFIMGDLSPASVINAYGSVGLGINYTREEESSYRYYISYDSTWHESKNPEETNTTLLFSLGGGLAYRFIKHFGAYIEIQYNMVSFGNSFFFYGFGAGYMPIRAGVTYYLY